MRRDVAWALTAFAIIIVVLIIASWIGYDRWSVEP
jgi:hypothetical protein